MKILFLNGGNDFLLRIPLQIQLHICTFYSNRVYAPIFTVRSTTMYYILHQCNVSFFPHAPFLECNFPEQKIPNSFLEFFSIENAASANLRTYENERKKEVKVDGLTAQVEIDRNMVE
jgi:hypothetical protein